MTPSYQKNKKEMEHLLGVDGGDSTKKMEEKESYSPFTTAAAVAGPWKKIGAALLLGAGVMYAGSSFAATTPTTTTSFSSDFDSAVVVGDLFKINSPSIHSCSAHRACREAGLTGDCCPTIDGTTLDCCNSPPYTLSGHGFCLDSKDKEYESFEVSDGYDDPRASFHFTPNNADKECSCKLCEKACLETDGCIGYEFFCCPSDGSRCETSGSILFSKGTRPKDYVPDGFSAVSVGRASGQPLVGDKYSGVGPISHSVKHPSWGSNKGGWSCFHR